MTNLFFKTTDVKPDFYYPFKFNFNGNNDIDMQGNADDNACFGDYLSACKPYLKPMTKESEEVWQQTKLYVFLDVFIN